MHPITHGLEAELLRAVASTVDEASLEELRVTALGKKGSISERMKTLSGMDPDERREAGAALNALKDKVAAAIAEKRRALAEAVLERRLATESADITLPVRPMMQRHHPSREPCLGGSRSDLGRSRLRRGRGPPHRG